LCTHIHMHGPVTHTHTHTPPPAQVKSKYSALMLDVFREVFNWLPLCYVLNSQVRGAGARLHVRDRGVWLGRWEQWCFKRPQAPAHGACRVGGCIGSQGHDCGCAAGRGGYDTLTSVNPVRGGVMSHSPR
jgi:hypothetical protein